MKTTITRLAKKQFSSMVQHRRYLHMHPCASFKEQETVQYIKQQLNKMGITYRDSGENGIVAKITSGTNGPCIAFRADIDALPITEIKPLEYASRKVGLMHACGHDAHTATLLGLAKLLSDNIEYVKGTIVFIFQYAEEIPPGGAAPMIADGCLDGVDKIYAYHVSDELDTGVIGVHSGEYMAASDTFSAEFIGEGGHGSRPHNTVDTVSAMCSAVIAINSIVGRFISAYDPAVISVCSVNGGTSYNVIPDRVCIQGTARSYDKKVANLIKHRIEQAIKTACENYGTIYNFSYNYGYPVLINASEQTDLVAKVAERIGHKVIEIGKTPVSEDFSYYLQQIPGCLFRVGIYNPNKDCIYPLHNQNFDVDEDHMLTVLECFLGIYLLETNQM